MTNVIYVFNDGTIERTLESAKARKQGYRVSYETVTEKNGKELCSAKRTEILETVGYVKPVRKVGR